ncbi:hypothetical protein A4259_02670 [Streptococcus pneumoniae]|nr:hypothetical protein A4259_02670 [Streptococcus pneumoniae]
MTSQQYQMTLFEESDMLMLSVEDFRARLSAYSIATKTKKAKTLSVSAIISIILLYHKGDRE